MKSLKIFLVFIFIILFCGIGSAAIANYTGPAPINTTESGNLNSSGLTGNETFFWVADTIDLLVYKYYTNGTYTGENFTSPSGSGYKGHSIGITTNSTFIWMVHTDGINGR